MKVFRNIHYNKNREQAKSNKAKRKNTFLTAERGEKSYLLLLVKAHFVCLSFTCLPKLNKFDCCFHIKIGFDSCYFRPFKAQDCVRILIRRRPFISENDFFFPHSTNRNDHFPIDSTGKKERFLIIFKALFPCTFTNKLFSFLINV